MGDRCNARQLFLTPVSTAVK